MKYDSNVIKSTEPPPRWQDLVKPYQKSDNLRSIWQLVNTIIPLFVMYYAMYRSLSYSYWLTLLLALPTAGLHIRTFIFQHDCGHGSFFSSSKANDIVGTICGFISIIPYYQWRHEHAIHHATSGDLSRRGIGDVNTLTVKEYLALSKWKRFLYAAYRNPIIMFLIGPIFVFGLASRFVGKNSGKREARNVYLTNAGILAQIVGWSMVIGLKSVVLLYLPTFVISGGVGIWLFYVQHQFDHSYWRQTSEWDYATSALQGSSYYRLPRLLQWFTGNIGFHHIHHLSPKVPNYRLQKCHEATPLFQNVTTFGILESFKCAPLRLWDEEHRRMVGFDYVRSIQ
ncbi:MAG: fatty acid desaturase [Acidobacteriota bacterium]|jgi:omega-6 fatty acid desaturase (delta-12 desaturase)